MPRSTEENSRCLGATWDSGPAAEALVCDRDSATRVSGGAQARGSSRSCWASWGTGRVLPLVGPSVRGWPLWGGQGWEEFTSCQSPYSRTSCFKASQLGPGRDSAFTPTWRVVIAITRWAKGRVPRLSAAATRALGAASVPRFLDGLRMGS